MSIFECEPMCYEKGAGVTAGMSGFLTNIAHLTGNESNSVSGVWLCVAAYSFAAEKYHLEGIFLILPLAYLEHRLRKYNTSKSAAIEIWPEIPNIGVGKGTMPGNFMKPGSSKPLYNTRLQKMRQL